ncbi:MAG TPA: hypothetical protein VER17_01875 [Tepidisphaeraceae bacterium]|nr:hypothetical protein [Tepidisphaeraceae bacterium]
MSHVTPATGGRAVGGFVVLLALILTPMPAPAADVDHKLVFDGVLAERRLSLKDLGGLPGDWSDYSHLVLEMRTSSPQRFGLWVYTADGPRRVEIQPFGQNVWLRASVPLQYLRGRDQAGNDLASATNRRTDSFWMSVWGPFGALKSVEAIGLAMEYPLNKPTIELRSVRLSKQDEGSAFLEKQPVTDEFGQWAHADWPRKVRSRQQLADELAEEERSFQTAAHFGHCALGGYRDTQAKATGFFRVEQIDGKWWFVDPHGHLYLSMGVNGVGRRAGRASTAPAGATTAATAAVSSGPGTAPTSAPTTADADPSRTTRRLESWGMTTGGQGRPVTVMLNWPRQGQTTFLGLPDVYSEAFARGVDEAARAQCAHRKDDPLVLGYFVGNEPPWGEREGEVVEMILAGPDSATKGQLKAYLADAAAGGDTPERRRKFVVAAFEMYLDLVNAALRRHDPNHLNLGIRFGGKPADDVLRTGRAFDVCSINVYEYEPTKQVQRAYRATGRPVLIGEFHLGVPENGLGSGLVQARDQAERGNGYRYYVEQAASLDGFVGAHWFQWRDQPVLGRGDGENYNIGFVDVTDRPYPEMVRAARATHERLRDVHAGKVLPFNQRPAASDAGTPSSPWD